MKSEYPLLSVDNVNDAIMFKNDLSSRFEKINLNFYVRRVGSEFYVELMDDVEPTIYFSVYQHAQKIFRNYYE